MTFSDLPTGLLLPVIIPVAIVLVVASLGIWIALHPREKVHQDTTEPAALPPPISTVVKDQPAVEAMV
jgi:hypothetical protein